MSNKSERIQRAFENSGMSIRELSKKTRIPRSTLHRYVTGRNRIPKAYLIVIADTLNIPPENLMIPDEAKPLEMMLLVCAYYDAPAKIQEMVDAMLAPYRDASSI